jgi:anti-sigma B factor antagonist
METVLEQNQIDDIITVNFNDVRRFNVTLADQVKNEFITIIEKGNKKIIFDLKGVAFIDSSGFGALVSIYNHAKENQAIFKICNVSSEAMELVQVTKLDKVFEIFPTIEECIKSY